MTSWMTRAGCAAVISLIGLGAGSAAFAQESTNRVATMTDWSVFAEKDPKECWGVSSPKETVNSKDGQPVSVRRGDILLFVTFRPGAKGEVSFSGGYPFAPDSTVEVNIGGNKFNLFTEGENAWAGSPAEDGRLVTALRGGSSAVVTGRSARGTVTADTFSLSGITSATNAAQANCK